MYFKYYKKISIIDIINKNKKNKKNELLSETNIFSKNELLNELKKGKKLKKATDRKLNPLQNQHKGLDMNEIMKKALELRRKSIKNTLDNNKI